MSSDSFKMALPILGNEGKDWVVNYFVAHAVDGQPGQYRDYKGGTNTYPKLGTTEPRHEGTDFNVPNFRWMDQGFAVYASAEGKVVRVHDGEPDRSTSRRCPGGLANRVEIEHPNGFFTRYGHLKKGSISVECGQDVATGEKIGVIGSSGSSDSPHLHFELRDAEENVLDPCHEDYWINPPMYAPTTFSIMDFSVQKGKVNLLQSRTPPAENVESVCSGEWITVGLFMSGLRANEKLSFIWRVGDREEIVYERSFPERKIENFMVAYTQICSLVPGRGAIGIFVNEKIVHACPVEVHPHGTW